MSTFGSPVSNSQPDLPEDHERRLPPELERLIFEWAIVGAERAKVVEYLLVSKRVCVWVRPSLYRVLTIEYTRCSEQGVSAWEPGQDPTFPGTLSRLSDVGPYVNCLLLNLDQDRQDRVLRTLIPHCPNLCDVALWYYEMEITRISSSYSVQSGEWVDRESVIYLLSQLPMKRISSPFQVTKKGSEFKVLDAFTSLTHLDLCLTSRTWETWSLVTHFTSLTHLMISSSCVELDVLSSLLNLKNLPILEVLLLLQHEEHYYHNSDWEAESDVTECLEPFYVTIQDLRLVLVQIHYGFREALVDWNAGTVGKFDFWEFAERVVYAKKRKLFRESWRNEQGWILREMNWDVILNEEGRKWYAGLDWDTNSERGLIDVSENRDHPVPPT